MNKLNINEISDNQLEAFSSHINTLINSVKNNNDFYTSRAIIDKVILQDEDVDLSDRNSVVYQRINNDNLIERVVEEEDIDEFSTLKDPILYRIYRTWVNNIKNACFPTSGDYVNIDRNFSSQFYKMGLKKFLPEVNQAWINIIKTENQRFNFKKKYSAAIAELVAYGNTGIVHYYDPSENIVNIKTPGIGRFSIYPMTDNWRESNLILEYDINYSDLLNRADLNPELIEAIKPVLNYNDLGDNQFTGSTSRLTDVTTQAPYGQVRCYDLFLPSVYLEDNQDRKNPITAKGVYITAIQAPETIEGTDLEAFGFKDNLVILAAYQDANPHDHGICLAAAGTTLPGVFYHQGFIRPFLSHQLLLNQLISGTSRVVGLLCDPPLNIIRNQDYDYDNRLEIPEFEPGAMYEGFDVKALIPPEYNQVVSQYGALTQVVTNIVEQSSGLSKAQMSGVTSSRTSASEIKEVVSSGQLNIVDASNQFDEEVLQPSVSNRIILTQQFLREQIQEIEDPAMREAMLLENPLFERLLNYSGIEEMYEQFYEENQNELDKNSEILDTIEGLFGEIKQLQEFAASPPKDFVPPDVTINPETLEQTPNAAEIEQLKMQHEQNEKAQRDQALNDVKLKQKEIERKKKEINGNVQEIPEPSLGLYYDLLAYPIKESDVQITGSKTTLSKEYARQNLKEFVGFLQAAPEILAEYDMSSVVEYFARTLSIPLSKLKKDEAEKRRDEAAKQQQAEFEQQLQLKYAQTPGAQPPKFR